jgi:hypothetical protein
MNREISLKVQSRAAEIFGVREDALFVGRKSDGIHETELAVIYAFWIAGQNWLEIGRHLGAGASYSAAVRDCVKLRKSNPIYSDKVGELVWFCIRNCEEKAA